MRGRIQGAFIPVHKISNYHQPELQIIQVRSKRDNCSNQCCLAWLLFELRETANEHSAWSIRTCRQTYLITGQYQHPLPGWRRGRKYSMEEALRILGLLRKYSDDSITWNWKRSHQTKNSICFKPGRKDFEPYPRVSTSIAITCSWTR